MWFFGRRAVGRGSQRLATTRELLGRFRIDDSIVCIGCRYSLRGLGVDGRCPECGRHVMGSTVHYLEERTGYSVDAFLFLLDAMRPGPAMPPKPRVHVDARGLLWAVGDRAVEQAGSVEEGRRLLAEWGVMRSEDVGAMVYSMVAVGLVGTTERDSPEDFDGVREGHAVFEGVGGQ